MLFNRLFISSICHSIHQFINQFTYLSICPFIQQSIRFSINPSFYTIYDYTSIHLSINASIYLSIHPYIHIYVHSHIYVSTPNIHLHVSIHPCIYLSIYLSIYSSIYLSIHLSTHVSIHPCIYLSINVSIYSSIYSSIHPSTHVSKLSEIFSCYMKMLSKRLIMTQLNSQYVHLFGFQVKNKLDRSMYKECIIILCD